MRFRRLRRPAISVAICILIIVVLRSSSNNRYNFGLIRHWAFTSSTTIGKYINEAAAVAAKKQRSKSVTDECVDILLADGNILTNVSSRDPPFRFQMMVFNSSVDRYISEKIRKQGLYEPEVARFVAGAIPRRMIGSGDERTSDIYWAVDIGSNVGFHTLHMAHRGARVIAFEPAPDTAALLRCSASLSGTRNVDGRVPGEIILVEAGASNVSSVGTMARHPDSPGMTSFVTNTSFPLQTLGDTDAGIGNTVRLLRAEDVLIEHNVPEYDRKHLTLLKVDVEGYELQALQGLNLTRFPFRYLLFEFFPELLRGAGTDPIDVLELVKRKGYKCNRHEMHVDSREMISAWVQSIKSHVNLFCELERSR